MRRTVLVTIASLSFGLASLAACSLGLDESLIDRIDAASLDVFVPGDVDVPDVGDGGTTPGKPEGGVCTSDADCATTDACLKSRCDLTQNRCVYDVCPQAACNSAACALDTRTCGAAKPYTMRAAQIPLGAAVGCGGVASRCIGAVYPYVFAGTANGVVAFSAADPANAAPPILPITGLTFLPTQILASGSRVFFLGASAGVGATARVPLAWIDVPAEPFETKLVAHSVLATLNRPAGAALALYAREKSTALLVDVNAVAQYPATILSPPLVEPLSLVATPLPGANLAPAATSGARLVVQGQTNPATAIPSFGLVTGAGTTSSPDAGTTALTATGPISVPQSFASEPGGAVFWLTESLTGPPVAAPIYVRAAKGWFLVADGAGSPDATSGVDVDLYPALMYAPGAGLIGPVALLDANTALVTTAVPATPAQTNVQFVKKAPLGLVKQADNVTVKKSVLPVAVGAIGVSASKGIGYVLTSESPGASSVYVFDAACGPP